MSEDPKTCQHPYMHHGAKRKPLARRFGDKYLCGDCIVLARDDVWRRRNVTISMFQNGKRPVSEQKIKSAMRIKQGETSIRTKAAKAAKPPYCENVESPNHEIGDKQHNMSGRPYDGHILCQFCIEEAQMVERILKTSDEKDLVESAKLRAEFRDRNHEQDRRGEGACSVSLRKLVL